MTRISSAGGLPRRLRSRAGIWLAALALVTLTPTLGYADERDVTVRWNPSPSEGVVSYLLYVGDTEQDCKSDSEPTPLTYPSVSPDGTVYSRTVPLEGSVDQYLALRARDGEGQESIFSNVIVVEALGMPGKPFVADPH